MDLINEIQMQIRSIQREIHESQLMLETRIQEKYKQINMLEAIIENLKKMEQCK